MIWAATAGALTLGLKNVKGAIASANAIPEDSVRNWTSQNDIERALDHSHSRLTFRANLTTLTEAERRKLESHRAGEDLYDKVYICFAYSFSKALKLACVIADGNQGQYAGMAVWSDGYAS